MNVLVTGGAGFIGSHLVERLLAEKHQVTVLDDLSTGSRDNLAQIDPAIGLSFVEGSVLDEHLVKRLVGQADQVYHLAAAVGVRRILERPLESIRTNLKGTEHVLDAMAPGQRLLLASTSEVYGKNSADALTEMCDSVMGPTSVTRWLYATSKAMDEFLALAHHRERGLQAVIVRFFNTVGPRQSGAYGMVLPNFVKAALAGEAISVYGDGTQSRNFTYVADAVEGITRLMRCEQAVGRVFNLGGKEEVTMLELANRVKKITSSRSPICYVPYSRAYPEGFEDMQRRRPDTTLLGEVTGFSPRTPLDTIIERVAEHLS